MRAVSGECVRARAVLVILVASAALLQTATAAHADLTSEAAVSENRDAAIVRAREGEAERNRHEQRRGTPAYDLVQYRRAPYCPVSGPVMNTPLNGECSPADGNAGVNGCGDDVPLEPLWTRSRASAAEPWSLWRQVDAGGCAVDVLPVLTADDFRRLPLPAPDLHVQPDSAWVLVHKETIVYTRTQPATLTTDLLGYPVTVEATPRRWEYDFGDGERLSTTDPGAPWPDFTTHHVYTALGARQITLTTEWSGRYQVAGSPVWRDVAGTAFTTATSQPFTVEERRSHLVAELCIVRPRPADC